MYEPTYDHGALLCGQKMDSTQFVTSFTSAWNGWTVNTLPVQLNGLQVVTSQIKDLGIEDSWLVV